MSVSVLSKILCLLACVGCSFGFVMVDHCSRHSSLVELAMASTIQQVAIGQTETQIRHQLFLGDVESQGGDLTGLKFWPTISLPMIKEINRHYLPKLLKKKKKDDKDSTTTVNMLELGAGCGLLGIGLAASNPKCRVVLTDANVSFVDEGQDLTSIQWLEQNVDINRELLEDRVSVSTLYWGNQHDLQSIIDQQNYHHDDNYSSLDVVMGSELLYNNDAAFKGLVETLCTLPNNPVILLGYKERRLGESKFFEIAKEHFDISWKRIGNRADNLQLAELRRKE